MTVLAAGPPLHDALPGILGLVVVAVMVGLTLWVRLRRMIGRTVPRARETAPYEHGPVILGATQGDPE